MRSPVKWYGGKGKMTAKLRQLVPVGGNPYVEPYAGGASLFFARDPAPVEVLNDLDGDLVTLYRVLQDSAGFRELAHRLRWTLYSQAEFARSVELRDMPDVSEVMRAWATFVRQNQGFSGTANTKGNWSRTFVSVDGMAQNACNWLARLSLLERFHDRLQRVQIDQRDAIEAIQYWDSPDTVFYVDPPYHHDTRAKRSRDRYAVEPGHDHHGALVKTLLACRGAVTMSCYEHAVYQPLIDAGWRVFRFEMSCHAAGRVRGSQLRGTGAATRHAIRTECVILNLKAARAVGPALSQADIFDDASVDAESTLLAR